MNTDVSGAEVTAPQSSALVPVEIPRSLGMGLRHHLGRHSGPPIPNCLNAFHVCKEGLYPKMLHYGPGWQMVLECAIDPSAGLILATCKVPSTTYADHFCSPEPIVVPAVLGLTECGNQALGTFLIYPRYGELQEQLLKGEVMGIRAFSGTYEANEEIDPNRPVEILLYASAGTVKKMGKDIPVFKGTGIIMQYDSTLRLRSKGIVEVTGCAVAYKPETPEEKRLLS